MVDFSSKPSVAGMLTAYFRDIDFSDPSLGTLNNLKSVIEFKIGDDHHVGNNFLLHVRGGEDPVGEIVSMCLSNHRQVFDPGTDRFIDVSIPVSNSYEQPHIEKANR